MSVACVEVPLQEASSFGVVQVDDRSRVIGWEEKPRSPKPLPGSSDRALASMCIYVFNTETPVRALSADALEPGSAHDFGHDVVPGHGAQQPACVPSARRVKDAYSMGKS